ARRWPARVAVESPAGSLSYAQLDRLAGSGAHALAVAPGTRVAIALPPGIDFVVALHACLRAGAIAVPVDLRDPRRAREAVVIDGPLPGGGPTLPGGEHDLAATALIVRT